MVWEGMNAGKVGDELEGWPLLRSAGRPLLVAVRKRRPRTQMKMARDVLDGILVSGFVPALKRVAR